MSRLILLIGSKFYKMIELIFIIGSRYLQLGASGMGRNVSYSLVLENI